MTNKYKIRHAVGLQLSCMASKDRFFIDQKVEDVNQEIKKVERRIKNINKSLVK